MLGMIRALHVLIVGLCCGRAPSLTLLHVLLANSQHNTTLNVNVLLKIP